MTAIKPHRTHRHAPHPVLHSNRDVVVCMYCFQTIGTLGARAKRATLEARHLCSEKVLAGQPAAPVPYN